MQPDESPIDAVTNHLTHDEVIAFLNERVKNHTCPCCSDNNWSIVGDVEHTLGMLAIQKNGSFSLPPPNVPIFSIACNTCGFLRSHALRIVAKWKLDRDARTP